MAIINNHIPVINTISQMFELLDNYNESLFSDSSDKMAAPQIQIPIAYHGLDDKIYAMGRIYIADPITQECYQSECGENGYPIHHCLYFHSRTTFPMIGKQIKLVFHFDNDMSQSKKSTLVGINIEWHDIHDGTVDVCNVYKDDLPKLIDRFDDNILRLVFYAPSIACKWKGCKI